MLSITASVRPVRVAEVQHILRTAAAEFDGRGCCNGVIERNGIATSKEVSVMSMAVREVVSWWRIAILLSGGLTESSRVEGYVRKDD